MEVRSDWAGFDLVNVAGAALSAARRRPHAGSSGMGLMHDKMGWRGVGGLAVLLFCIHRVRLWTRLAVVSDQF